MVFVSNPIYLYPGPVPLFLFRLVSPEFCYRPGLSAVSEDGAGSGGGGGAPTRPLPPTPDDDDAHPDRTLVMKRVSLYTVYSAYVLTYMSLCSDFIGLFSISFDC